MYGTALLHAVVRQRVWIFKVSALENEALLVRRTAFSILKCDFHVRHGIVQLHLAHKEGKRRHSQISHGRIAVPQFA